MLLLYTDLEEIILYNTDKTKLIPHLMPLGAFYSDVAWVSMMTKTGTAVKRGDWYFNHK